MRKLDLHVSALNDAEYDLYTSSLNDIAGDDEAEDHEDAYFEEMKIGVREARAWLRGRYSSVSTANIDIILKFFSPNLSPADVITGGQFFAALRMVLHTESGKEVDRGLAFVQVYPGSAAKSRPQSPPSKRLYQGPPPPPQRRQTDHSTPTLIPETPAPVSHNPFSQRTAAAVQPPLHPLQRSEAPAAHPNNPFLHQSRRGLSTRSESGSAQLPPLPPRKPAPPVPTQPPRQVSTLAPPRAISPNKSPSVSPHRHSSTSPPPHGLPYHHPAPPPPPQHKLSSHVTSTLMKQSLQASKVAQSMKKAEEQLEKERVLQVLKSSSVVSGTNVRNRSASPNPYKVVSPPSASSGSDGASAAPPLPKRRVQQQRPSPPLSASSLEQVAFATSGHQRQGSLSASAAYNTFNRKEIHQTPFHNLDANLNSTSTTTTTSRTSSPSLSPTRASTDLPSAPPTHPDRKQHSFFQSNPAAINTTKFTPPRASPSDARAPSDSDSFEMIYGPGPSSSALSLSSPTPTMGTPTQAPLAPTTLMTTPATPSSATSTHSSAFDSVFSSPSTPNRPGFGSRASEGPPGSLNEESPTARVFRSKSMHIPSVSTSSPGSGKRPPVPPPLRKRRPESAQVFGTMPRSAGFVEGSGVASDTDGGTRSPSSMSRHTSMSAPFSAGARRREPSFSGSANSWTSTLSSPIPVSGGQAHADGKEQSGAMTNIQRTLATLQQQTRGVQPRLEKARYKAEAGLSRRGFVRSSDMGMGGGDAGVDGEEGLQGLVRSNGDVGEGRERAWLAPVGPRSYGFGKGEGAEVYDEPEVDSDSSGVDLDGEWDRDREGRIVTRGRGRGGSVDGLGGSGERWVGVGMEKDNLKWPVGEGWKPL